MMDDENYLQQIQRWELITFNESRDNAECLWLFGEKNRKVLSCFEFDGHVIEGDPISQLVGWWQAHHATSTGSYSTTSATCVNPGRNEIVFI